MRVNTLLADYFFKLHSAVWLASFNFSHIAVSYFATSMAILWQKIAIDYVIVAYTVKTHLVGW